MWLVNRGPSHGAHLNWPDLSDEGGWELGETLVKSNYRRDEAALGEQLSTFFVVWAIYILSQSGFLAPPSSSSAHSPGSNDLPWAFTKTGRPITLWTFFGSATIHLSRITMARCSLSQRWWIYWQHRECKPCSSHWIEIWQKINDSAAVTWILRIWSEYMNVIAHHRVGGGQNLKHHGNTEGIRGHKGEKAKSAENLPKLFNTKNSYPHYLLYKRWWTCSVFQKVFFYHSKWWNLQDFQDLNP